MKHRYLQIIFWIALFLTAIPLLLAFQTKATDMAEEDWAEGIGDPTVAGLSDNVLAITGLYHTGGDDGVNAGIILTRESVIFIDAGMSIASAEFIWKEASKIMGDRNNLYLILTHHHSDHIFGMRIFKEKGAEVISHNGTKAFINSRGAFYKNFLLGRLGWNDDKGNRVFGDIVLSLPDQVVGKDTTYNIDGEEIHILCTPGHVHTELAIYHPRSKTLFTGDALYVGMEPTTHFGGPTEWRQWISQLERLKRLDIKTVCPGHGPLCTKEELDKNIAYLKKLLD
jgi:glyoxylase-like metal-dependent hydrolase (beta-lactamase superfamily II)